MASTSELTACLEFSLELARRSGDIALQNFQSGVTADIKTDGSPVTIVDRTIEKFLRETIHAHYPGDAVLGEELGELPGTSGRRWIVDPIDGTASFVRGIPLFGVMIALEVEGVPILGTVHLPALNETVFAASGQGCWWLPGNRNTGSRPIRAHVSSTERLSEGLLLVGGFEYFRGGCQAHYERLVQSAKMQRSWADCYGQILVATGRADVLVEALMNTWDAAPFIPILQEAGGSFTDWNGNCTAKGGNSVSSNGKMSEEVLRLLRD